MENSYVTEFENWAQHLEEGTWATPEQDEDHEKLRDLMAKPIATGPNGDNASAVFYNLIGSDSLYDEFYEISQSDTGPDTDVRPLVVEWLQSHGFQEMAQEFAQQLQQQAQTTVDSTQPQPGELTPQANTPAPASPAPQQEPVAGTRPAVESVDNIRRLAGLRTLRRV